MKRVNAIELRKSFFFDDSHGKSIVCPLQFRKVKAKMTHEGVSPPSQNVASAQLQPISIDIWPLFFLAWTPQKWPLSSSFTRRGWSLYWPTGKKGGGSYTQINREGKRRRDSSVTWESVFALSLESLQILLRDKNNPDPPKSPKRGKRVLKNLWQNTFSLSDFLFSELYIVKNFIFCLLLDDLSPCIEDRKTGAKGQLNA